MSLDLNAILPVFAASAVVVLILVFLILKIKTLLPVTVNCWFCATSTKVRYNETSNWVCPTCDQYNGFAEDGDYNKVIPAQFDECLNIPTASVQPMRFERQNPTLCHKCNINQQLKVTQLANFVAVNPNNFDKEIESYRQELDVIYRICKRCERKLSEVLLKEKVSFLETLNGSSVLDSVTVKGQSQKPSRLTFYGTVFGCFFQLLDILITVTHKDLLTLFPKYLFQFGVIQYLCNLINYKYVLNIIQEYYYTYHIPFHLVLIGFCIFVYLIEFVLRRTFLNFTSLSVWCILLSLKYFYSSSSSYVIIFQGVAALMFLIINIENYFKNKIKERKFSVKDEKAGKKTLSRRTFMPYNELPEQRKVIVNNCVSKSANSAFTDVKQTSSRGLLKCTIPDLSSNTDKNCSPKSPVSSTETSGKLCDDFGLSNLYLGTRKRGLARNHLLLEPKPYSNQLADNIWNRSSVLSPPRLNVNNHHVYTSSLSPNLFDASPSQTRCSSQTSGVGSLSSTPQPQETDFDRYCDSPINHHHQNRLSHSNFYSMPYDPIYQQQQQLAISPYMYYQFATMFHRMYTPSTTFDLSDCSSDKTINHSTNQCNHNYLYVSLIFVIILCNFILIGLMCYKEFIAAKV